jgi:hypothetical protein
MPSQQSRDSTEVRSGVATQLPAGSLQQSPLVTGSLLPASRTTFQLPSACFRQIVMYRPLVVTALPFASLL